MTEWPSDRVTEWPSDRVTKWPSDQVTGSFADDWPDGIFAWPFAWASQFHHWDWDWDWIVKGFPKDAATKERMGPRIVPEMNCKVQEDKASYSIVHIYEEVDLQWYNVKLKKLLCLGSLISTRHILTTKLCFGAGPNGGPDGWGQWKPTVSIFKRNQCFFHQKQKVS